jgi:hypothetical protein
VARVVARDPDADGAAAAVAAAIEELRATGRTVGEPALDEPALLVVTSPGEPYLVAHYRRARWDGTVTPAEVPPEAPSRAYAKLEEAIAWAGLPVGAGQVAVEIGAAPGGAAYALARRGVTVHAVDPGDLDPRVLSFRGPRRRPRSTTCARPSPASAGSSSRARSTGSSSTSTWRRRSRSTASRASCRRGSARCAAR